MNEPSTPIDETEMEAQLRALMKQTERLDVPRVLKCEQCGSRFAQEGRGKPYEDCSR